MTTIFIDCDGVLADFHRAILDRWNKEHHTSHITDDWDDWYGTKIFAGDNSWWKYTEEPGFWRKLDLLEGAQALVNTVAKSGLPWAFLTCLYLDRSPLAAQERADWIEEHFGKEARSHLLITAGDTKANVVHKGDILIDDCAKYIQEADDIGAITYCFRRPWNMKITNSYLAIEYLTNALNATIKTLTAEPSSYSELGEAIGSLVEEKQKAYGSSFSRANKLFEVLYPSGIEVKDYGKVLLLARVFDKIFRYITLPNAFGESPWEDIAGYSLLEALRHRKAKKDGSR